MDRRRFLARVGLLTAGGVAGAGAGAGAVPGSMTDAGYRFVTVSDLLAASAPESAGGPPSRSPPA